MNHHTERHIPSCMHAHTRTTLPAVVYNGKLCGAQICSAPLLLIPSQRGCSCCQPRGTDPVGESRQRPVVPLINRKQVLSCSRKVPHSVWTPGCRRCLLINSALLKTTLCWITCTMRRTVSVTAPYTKSNYPQKCGSRG